MHPHLKMELVLLLAMSRYTTIFFFPSLFTFSGLFSALAGMKEFTTGGKIWPTEKKRYGDIDFRCALDHDPLNVKFGMDPDPSYSSTLLLSMWSNEDWCRHSWAFGPLLWSESRKEPKPVPVLWSRGRKEPKLLARAGAGVDISDYQLQLRVRLK